MKQEKERAVESHINGSGSLDREVGRLDGRMGAAESDILEIKSNLKEVLVTVTSIKSTMDEAKGGWKTIAWFSGLSGVGGIVVAKLTSLIGIIPAK